MTFLLSELLHRIVVVTEYTIIDNKGEIVTVRPVLTQYGLVKKVEGSTLTIALSKGTAMADEIIEKRFDDPGWQLAFPPAKKAEP